MPELPEIEHVNKELSCLIGLKIKEVQVINPKLRYPVPDLQCVLDKTIDNVTRRGKCLVWSIEGSAIIIHFGMTGKIRFDEARQKHDHVYFIIGDYRFFYNDVRKFGYFSITDSPEEYFKTYGPEPLDKDIFSGSYLLKKSGKKNIKSVIMNQKIVVGVGNIYACESLFHASINPNTKTLSIRQAKRLCDSIRSVLLASIEQGGTSFSDYLHTDGTKGNFFAQLKVYQQKQCHFCQHRIEFSIIDGRKSYYCPKCQPLD